MVLMNMVLIGNHKEMVVRPGLWYSKERPSSLSLDEFGR